MARHWLTAREADLLTVEYYQVPFTVPAPIGAIAHHNKAVVYDLLVQAAAETLLIAVPVLPRADVAHDAPTENARPCPCRGAPGVIIETFARGHAPRAPPSAMGEAA